jgi:hypothetical protein
MFSLFRKRLIVRFVLSFWSMKRFQFGLCELINGLIVVRTGTLLLANLIRGEEAKASRSANILACFQNFFILKKSLKNIILYVSKKLKRKYVSDFVHNSSQITDTRRVENVCKYNKF